MDEQEMAMSQLQHVGGNRVKIIGEEENYENANHNTLSSAYIRVEDDVPERDYNRTFTSNGQPSSFMSTS